MESLLVSVFSHYDQPYFMSLTLSLTLMTWKKMPSFVVSHILSITHTPFSSTFGEILFEELARSCLKSCPGSGKKIVFIVHLLGHCDKCFYLIYLNYYP